jgi:hypothetical protein
MNEWLRERRFTLLVVGVAVPLIAVMSFWSDIRPEWPLWLACYLVGFPAGIVAIWGRQHVGAFWSRLGTRQRVHIVCFAAVAVWLLLVFFPGNRSNRFFDASATTAVGLLFLGGYAGFSRMIDRIWFRIHKR